LYAGSFESFTECYIELIKEVYNNPTYMSAPRGQKIKEKLGVSFTIENPRDRIPYVAGRKFSISYMVAELLWYLSANNKTEWISRYSAFWKDISDDGVTANSAYGARLFEKHPKIADGRYRQWQYVVNELNRDRDSRRAVMHLRVPADSIDARLDVPCTLSLQFFIRDEKLHMIVNMRSSDLIFGIAYDIPAFTLFQEILAEQLEVGLGSYTHMSNSLHIYERHFEMVEGILARENRTLKLHETHGPMPPLGSLNCKQWVLEGWIETLMKAEDHISSLTSPIEIQQAFNTHFISTEEADNVWSDWARVLAAHRLRKLGFTEDANRVQNQTAFSGYSFNIKKEG